MKFIIKCIPLTAVSQQDETQCQCLMFLQFEPLDLHKKTGRKVFLDLGSRRGEYFSHFHKFWYFEGFEWVLFECNK